jgi:uncharacterized protein GlcG (DUF336 family)
MTNQCVTFAFLGGLMLTGAGATAQAAAESPFHDRPASPRSLPADNLPPFLMLDDSGNLIPKPPMPPGALHRGPGAEAESTAPGPTLSQAIEAAHAAVESCAASGYRVGAAVIDSVGEARAMLTADGSDGSHVFVAMRKALTALRFEMPSSKANELVPKDPELMARVTPNMFVAGGAVPIVLNGQTIGAIGVSGAGGGGGNGAPMVLGQADETCAAAGLRKITKQLK